MHFGPKEGHANGRPMASPRQVISGTNMTVCDVAAALGITSARTEPYYHIIGTDEAIYPPGGHRRQELAQRREPGRELRRDGRPLHPWTVPSGECVGWGDDLDPAGRHRGHREVRWADGPSSRPARGCSKSSSGMVAMAWEREDRS